MSRQLQTEDATFDIRETDLEEIPEADGEVVYTLRELTTKKWRELHKQHTRKVLNKATRRLEPELDGEAFSDALVDFVIADWSGITERGGAPAPCTRENKLRLDGVLKSALVGSAGLTQIVQEPEDRDQSFRATSDVG